MKVSVIIPIWGVEEYIERCARSLFEQTLDSIEFIFINDCTPDKSIEILNNVIKDYPNRIADIKILHHNHNKGLPQARETGIKVATGDYIIHCDSDDWVDKRLYEEMYHTAVINDLDVVVCQMKETDGREIYNIKLFPDVTNQEITNRILYWINEGSLCNKLFKRSVYKNDIKTPMGAMAEDKCLVLQLIYYCHKIGITPDYNYYIWKNPNSIIRLRTEQKILKNFNDGIDNYKIIEDFYKSHNAINGSTAEDLFSLKYLLRDNLRSLLGKPKYHKIWMSTFPELYDGILFNKQLTLKQRIRSILIKYKFFPLPWEH